MTLTIELEEMHFYAFHGVLAQEQKVGNHYTINLSLGLNVYSSLASDILSDTINYAEVYDVIKDEMDNPSLLLECVVGRITKRLMLDFDMIETIDIKLSKVKPPIAADIKASAVRLQIKREELRAFLANFV